MRIVGIPGSLRKDSYNKKLLAYATKVAAEQGVRIETVEIGGLPVLNQDDEVPNPPESVIKFRDRLHQADAILFATPEYNYSIPGGLKNAIDWGSRPPQNVFADKLVAVMGATVGGLGTISAQKELRHIMLILNALVVPQPFVMISAAQNAFDEQGNLTVEPAAKNVGLLLKRLIEVTRAIKGLP